VDKEKAATPEAKQKHEELVQKIAEREGARVVESSSIVGDNVSRAAENVGVRSEISKDK
jgi:hypothetical protein